MIHEIHISGLLHVTKGVVVPDGHFCTNGSVVVVCNTCLEGDCIQVCWWWVVVLMVLVLGGGVEC